MAGCHGLRVGGGADGDDLGPRHVLVHCDAQHHLALPAAWRCWRARHSSPPQTLGLHGQCNRKISQWITDKGLSQTDHASGGFLHHWATAGPVTDLVVIFTWAFLCDI